MRFETSTKGNATRLFIDENDGTSLGYIEMVSSPRAGGTGYSEHRIAKGDTMEETVTTTVTLETFKRVWKNAANPKNLHPLILAGIHSIIPCADWLTNEAAWMENEIKKETV